MIPKDYLDKLRGDAEEKMGGTISVSASFFVLLIDERNHFSNALTFLEWYMPGGIAIVARALSETTHDSIGSQKA